VGRSFFRFVTIHVFDRQTDRKALQHRALQYMQSHGEQEAHHEIRQRTWPFLRRHRKRTTKYNTYCLT